VKLATLRLAGRTTAARIEVDNGEAVEVSVSDVGALLHQPDWAHIAAAAAGARHSLGTVDYAPLVPRPEKIFCVGQNYRAHIAEQGIEPPKFPTLFAKFSSSLTGAHDDIELPDTAQACDWEVEVAAIIGSRVRHARAGHAMEAVAGYAVLNDVSMRDWQYRTSQFLQGKTFDRCTPLGPWLVTRDDADIDESALQLSCELNGEQVQTGSSSDLLFDVAYLVGYMSEFATLAPGDVIATGTPGGSGHWRQPPRYLKDGDVLVTRIAGLGECRNVCRRENVAAFVGEKMRSTVHDN
jgi:acylpyruvate hydrolase